MYYTRRTRCTVELDALRTLTARGLPIAYLYVWVLHEMACGLETTECKLIADRRCAVAETGYVAARN